MPTVTRTGSIASRPTNWSDQFTLDQIDPALGVQSLVVTLSGTLDSWVYVTNADAAPVQFFGAGLGSVALSRPDGSSWLTATPTAVFSQVIAPGLADSTILTATGSASASSTYVAGRPGAPEANQLVGNGTVDLPVAASARVHAIGPGNMFASFSSRIAAGVSVTAEVTLSPSTNTTFSSSTTILLGNSPIFNFSEKTTEAQVVHIADATTGTHSRFSLAPFNAMLGQLKSVTIAVTPDARGSAQVENFDLVAASAAVGQKAGVSMQTTGGTVLAAADENASMTVQLSAFDGAADFVGSSSGAFDENFSNWPLRIATTVSGAAVSAFQGDAPVLLDAVRTGSTTVDGPGNMMVQTELQSGATVEVSYTYRPYDIRITDPATRITSGDFASAYTGPVAGLQKQFIWSDADNTSIVGDTPNIFIKGGAGDDALQVTSGNNVLDGGAGSNFLVGGTGSDGGHDTFFVDARGGGTIWSTIVNFHAGDMATIFGFGGSSTRPLTASDGVAGYTGLTIHSETAGPGSGVNASITFAGIDEATAAQHFVYTSGTLPGDIGYLLIQYA